MVRISICRVTHPAPVIKCTGIQKRYPYLSYHKREGGDFLWIMKKETGVKD